MSIIRRSVTEQIENTSPESDTESVVHEFDLRQQNKELAHKFKTTKGPSDELSDYLKTVTSFKSNPIESWEDMTYLFLGLYKQFLSHAVIVASSVPSERLFSKAGFIVNQERNRLKPKRKNELLFLASRPENGWF